MVRTGLVSSLNVACGFGVLRLTSSCFVSAWRLVIDFDVGLDCGEQLVSRIMKYAT